MAHIPIRPDWQEVVGAIYRAHGSYHAILNKLAEPGLDHDDHSFLCYLRSGKRKKVSFEYGAALMNLYQELKP